MTKNQIQTALRARGLPISGTKSELCARLQGSDLEILVRNLDSLGISKEFICHYYSPALDDTTVPVNYCLSLDNILNSTDRLVAVTESDRTLPLTFKRRIKDYARFIAGLIETHKSKVVRQNRQMVLRGNIEMLSHIVWSAFPKVIEIFNMVHIRQDLVSILLNCADALTTAEYVNAKWFLGLVIYLIKEADRDLRRGRINSNARYVSENAKQINARLGALIINCQLPSVPR